MSTRFWSVHPAALELLARCFTLQINPLVLLICCRGVKGVHRGFSRREITIYVPANFPSWFQARLGNWFISIMIAPFAATQENGCTNS